MFSGRKGNVMENIKEVTVQNEASYTYETVKGEMEIELDPEWVEILKDMDHEWKKTAHRQDCREVSVVMLEGYEGCAAYKDDPLTQAVNREDELESEQECEVIMKIFTEKEKHLVENMLLKGKKGCKYADEIGVSGSVVSRRKTNIEKKAKSFYENSKKTVFKMR